MTSTVSQARAAAFESRIPTSSLRTADVWPHSQSDMYDESVQVWHTLRGDDAPMERLAFLLAVPPAVLAEVDATAELASAGPTVAAPARIAPSARAQHHAASVRSRFASLLALALA